MLLDAFQPPRHARISDLMGAFFAQPWLAEEIVKVRATPSCGQYRYLPDSCGGAEAYALKMF